MDNRAIGVFDSGYGGLTAVNRLRSLLPDENIIYLGDTLHLPYGDKTDEFIRECAKKDIDFLLSKNVKAVLVACVSATSSLYSEDFKRVPVLCEGAVYPAALAAVKATKNKKIGVLGTAATIRMGKFEGHIKELMPECEVISIACPKFVPLVEAGKVDGSEPEVKEAVKEYLTPLKEAGADTVILGCTHYPHLSAAIEEFYSEALLINAGAQTAEHIAKNLKDKALLSSDGKGEIEFFVSGDEQGFMKNAHRFFDGEINKAQKAVL